MVGAIKIRVFYVTVVSISTMAMYSYRASNCNIDFSYGHDPTLKAPQTLIDKGS